MDTIFLLYDTFNTYKTNWIYNATAKAIVNPVIHAESPLVSGSIVLIVLYTAIFSTLHFRKQLYIMKKSHENSQDIQIRPT
jgi:hypothetical protein